MTFRELATIPNTLSASRVALAPLFVHQMGQDNQIALLSIAIIAALTDFLDGQIARRQNQQSPLGTLIDLIGDSVFLFTALVTYALYNILSVFEFLLLNVAAAIQFMAAYIVYRRTGKIDSPRYAKAAGAANFFIIIWPLARLPGLHVFVWLVIVANLFIGSIRLVVSLWGNTRLSR